MNRFFTPLRYFTTFILAIFTVIYVSGQTLKNMNLRVVGYAHNFECCNDGAGISCGFAPNRPEPRYRIRTDIGSGWQNLIIINPGTQSCGSYGRNDQLALVNGTCISSFGVEVEMWEDDCGGDNTYDNCSVNADNNRTYSTPYYNFGIWSPGSSNNFSISGGGGYRVDFNITWSYVPAPTLDGNSVTAICPGGTAALNVSAPQVISGGTFRWFTSASGGAPIHTGANFSPSPLVSTTYYVEYFANGCETARIAVPVNVSIPVAPTISPVTICANQTATLTATSPGATSYRWYTNNNYTGLVFSGSSFTTPALTTTTTYYVTAIIAAGCESTPTPVTVTVNPLPGAPTIAANSATLVCTGTAVNLSSSILGGISWSDGSVGDTIFPTVAGAYTAVYTDANGCASAPSNSITISNYPVPAAPVITPQGPTTFCPGGAIFISSSYSSGNTWHDNSTGSFYITSTNQTVSAIYTDANGCNSPSSNVVNVVVLTPPNAPVITANGPTIFCPGDSVELVADYTTGLFWSNLDQSANTYVSAPGNYTVTHTDANGCISAPSAPVSITNYPQPTPPTISASGPTTFCIGNDVTLTSSESQNNEWTTNVTSPSITVNTTGSYAVRFTDGNGCTSAYSTPTQVVVNQLPAAPSISSATGGNAFCQFDSLQLISSVSTGVTWSTNQTSPSIYITSPGTYSVTTTDVNGCTSAASASFTAVMNTLPTPPVISFNGSTAFCAGGGVYLLSNYINGNTWSSGGNGQAELAQSSGAYTVRHTDANGCTSFASNPVTVTVYPTPTAQFGAVSDSIFCGYEGAVNLGGGSPSGGVYSGDGVFGNQFFPNKLNPGTYTISYTYISSDGCVATDEQTMIVDACLGEEPLTNNTVLLFPNPTQGNLTLQLQNPGAFETYHIVSMNGQRILSGMIQNTPTINLDVTDLASGVYFIQLQGTQVSTLKFIKQ